LSEILAISAQRGSRSETLGDSLGASDPVRGLTPRRLAPLGQGKILPLLEGDRIEEDGQIFDPPSQDIVSLHLVPSP
jgi:hypothetical protein